MERHVVITNREHAGDDPWVVSFTLKNRDGLDDILAWYGAYCSGDDYDVTVNGKTVTLDLNGCPEPETIDAIRDSLPALNSV